MASRKHTKRPPPPEVVVDEFVPDGGYDAVPWPVAQEPHIPPPFDKVVVSSVPVCEEKTGHVIKMNYFNAAGQLVR